MKYDNNPNCPNGMLESNEIEILKNIKEHCETYCMNQICDACPFAVGKCMFDDKPFSWQIDKVSR